MKHNYDKNANETSFKSGDKGFMRFYQFRVGHIKLDTLVPIL